jgi:hypothetical protein
VQGVAAIIFAAQGHLEAISLSGPELSPRDETERDSSSSGWLDRLFERLKSLNGGSYPTFPCLTGFFQSCATSDCPGLKHLLATSPLLTELQLLEGGNNAPPTPAVVLERLEQLYVSFPSPLSRPY